MWNPLKNDTELMDAMAYTWARPIAQGYLPPKYRDHLAGGRLIALSKHPKPGVRPICISDAIRRLVAKGLNSRCRSSFTNVFQQEHPRALQFGANLQNGASNMFHLVNSIAHQATGSPDDPIAIAALDIKNAFNTLTRAQLFTVLQHNFAQAPDPPPDPSSSGGASPTDDLHFRDLWSHIMAHHGTKGILKLYHSGSTYTILSETGVQQGDPLASNLFALALHPQLCSVARRHSDILITAYADNIIITGPLSKVGAATLDLKDALATIGLKLNTLE